MKKLLVAIVSCLATHGLAFSQVVEKSSSFQLTLFPPLSTNGVRSYQYTNLSLIHISEPTRRS